MRSGSFRRADWLVYWCPGTGDPILRSVHFSLGEDSQWQRGWMAEAVGVAIADTPNNEEVIRRWIDGGPDGRDRCRITRNRCDGSQRHSAPPGPP